MSSLRSLGYDEPAGRESAPLLQRLLDDLVATTETYEAVRQRAEHEASAREEEAAALRPLQTECARLVRENNQLHLELVRQKETAARAGLQQQLASGRANDELATLRFVVKRQKAALRKASRKEKRMLDRIRMLRADEETAERLGLTGEADEGLDEDEDEDEDEEEEREDEDASEMDDPFSAADADAEAAADEGGQGGDLGASGASDRSPRDAMEGTMRRPLGHMLRGSSGSGLGSTSGLSAMLGGGGGRGRRGAARGNGGADAEATESLRAELEALRMVLSIRDEELSRAHTALEAAAEGVRASEGAARGAAVAAAAAAAVVAARGSSHRRRN